MFEMWNAIKGPCWTTHDPETSARIRRLCKRCRMLPITKSIGSFQVLICWMWLRWSRFHLELGEVVSHPLQPRNGLLCVRECHNRKSAVLAHRTRSTARNYIPRSWCDNNKLLAVCLQWPAANMFYNISTEGKHVGCATINWCQDPLEARISSWIRMPSLSWHQHGAGSVQSVDKPKWVEVGTCSWPNFWTNFAWPGRLMLWPPYMLRA